MGYNGDEYREERWGIFITEILNVLFHPKLYDKIIYRYHSGLFPQLPFDSVIPLLEGDNSRRVPIDAYFNP